MAEGAEDDVRGEHAERSRWARVLVVLAVVIGWAVKPTRSAKSPSRGRS
jgi:hypothetical protein